MCLQEKYYSCNEILRDSFYDNQWNIEKIERHTIFCCQGTYPIKGLHYMIEALYLLKNYYADAKLYVAGSNITDISDRYHKQAGIDTTKSQGVGQGIVDIHRNTLAHRIIQIAALACLF